MSKNRAVTTYLVLILLMGLLAIAITYSRSGVDNLIGETINSNIEAVKSFGMIIGLNVFVGFLIKWPSSVIWWIPISTVFVLVAHQQLGDWFELASLDEMGRMNAFLMYLPSVGMASLLGGMLGMLFGGKSLNS